MYKILILGPQGSGKGTQAQILSKKSGIPALSMGQLLRNEMASGSELGNKIKGYVDAGNLVPDDVALNVLKARLAQDDAQSGYILDGYPRNEAQYQVFKDFDTPTHLLVITVPEEESMKRMQSRAEIEQRTDDTPEILKKRLSIYHNDTKPVIDHYREMNLVKEIDGIGEIVEIEDRVWQAIQ